MPAATTGWWLRHVHRQGDRSSLTTRTGLMPCRHCVTLRTSMPPGLNVIGAGEPALPGISIGHNERIAFGLTIFPIDQEDLYVYDLKDGQYRYGEGWESFRTISEKVAIRGAPEVDVELKFTAAWPGRVRDRHACICRPCSLAGTRYGALLRQCRVHAGLELAGIPGCAQSLGRTGRKPGIRGRGRQYRLQTCRSVPASTELGWFYCQCRATVHSNGMAFMTWMCCRSSTIRSAASRAPRIP